MPYNFATRTSLGFDLLGSGLLLTEMQTFLKSKDNDGTFPSFSQMQSFFLFQTLVPLLRQLR